MSEAKTKKTFKQQQKPAKPMNRDERRQHAKFSKKKEEAARKKIVQRAEDAILRAKILNEPPKMKMTIDDAIQGYVAAGWPVDKAIERVNQLCKEQLGELTPQPKGEYDGCHPTEPKSPEVNEQ